MCHSNLSLYLTPTPFDYHCYPLCVTPTYLSISLLPCLTITENSSVSLQPISLSHSYPILLSLLPPLCHSNLSLYLTPTLFDYHCYPLCVTPTYLSISLLPCMSLYLSLLSYLSVFANMSIRLSIIVTQNYNLVFFLCGLY